LIDRSIDESVCEVTVNWCLCALGDGSSEHKEDEVFSAQRIIQ